MIDAQTFFGGSSTPIFHGSPHEVIVPEYGKGSPYNDYGAGFYCTESRQLASEWACPTLDDGCVNEYQLDLEGLQILDLSSPEYSELNWLAVLLANRRFELSPTSSVKAKDFLLKHYSVDLSKADIIHGYRADDSYFSFARAFLDNHIGVNALKQALFLGGLGYQVVLKSPAAFECIHCVSSTIVDGLTWNPKRQARDLQARQKYQEIEAHAYEELDDVLIIDLMREAAWGK